MKKTHSPFPHLWNFAQMFLKTPQNDKQKIKDFETLIY
jgi:hypothetical protein